MTRPYGPPGRRSCRLSPQPGGGEHRAAWAIRRGPVTVQAYQVPIPRWAEMALAARTPQTNAPTENPWGSQRPERLCQCPYAAHARVHEKRTQAGKRYCLRSHRSEHNPGGSAPDLRGCGWVGRWIPLANPSPTETASYTMVRHATMQTPPGRGSAEGARVPRGLHQHDEDSVNRGQALRRPPAPDTYS